MIERVVYKIPSHWHNHFPHFVKVLLNRWMKKAPDRADIPEKG